MDQRTDKASLGTLTSRGDRWTLEFTRRLAHSREKVWRAVTEPVHLAVWFPQQIVGDRRAGAPLRFVSSAGDSFDGQMLVFDPPSVMEFTWGTDLLRIELRQDGEGTLLTLTDTFDDVGKAARDAAGWHECLDRLVADLDGLAPSVWGADAGARSTRSTWPSLDPKPPPSARPRGSKSTQPARPNPVAWGLRCLFRLPVTRLSRQSG